MPGVRVMAIGAAQQAARDEENDAQARAVVSRRCLVGMAVAEGAVGFLQLRFIRRVRRNADVDVIPAAGFERPDLRHDGSSLDCRENAATVAAFLKVENRRMPSHRTRPFRYDTSSCRPRLERNVRAASEPPSYKL